MVSSGLKEKLFDQEMGDAIIPLLTISHPDLAEPIRVCHNNENLVSRGNTYIAYDWRLTLPLDDPDTIPRAKIQIDNVDRVIVDTIRSISTAPTVTVELVKGSDPDTVEFVLSDFTLQDVEYDVLFVTGQLTVEEFLSEPFPGDTFTPSRFPGLF